MISQGKKINNKIKQKVFVGLSGGVDSAVSAALLKKEGYEVTGVFIKAWTPPGYPCTWKEDRRSAMRAAAVLDISFITLDLEKEYKEGVVDYMIAEYKSGQTPNPDVMCNKEIKFGSFLKWAIERGADFVATGHYAVNRIMNNEYRLLEGKDKNKDQSYFLWTLTQDQLKNILFPVGNIKKDKVRELAERFGLPQAARKDSQGLCFLGQVDMKEFLSRYITPKKGDVLNAQNGKVIGYHNGAVFFTIGERHGFTITQKGVDDKPFYVVGKDIEKNTISVAPKLITPQIQKRQRASLSFVNWVEGEVPKSKNLSCRLRYRQEKIKCGVKNEKGEIKIILEGEHYVSPGQSLVLYGACPDDSSGRNNVCLGGGIMR